jgi:acetate kinase
MMNRPELLPQQDSVECDSAVASNTPREHFVLSLNAGSSSLKFCCFSVRDAGEAMSKFRAVYQGSVSDISSSATASLRVVLCHESEERCHQQSLGVVASMEEACIHAIAWIKKYHEKWGPLAIIGHRVVFGGAQFKGPTVINSSVVEQLETLSRYAPEHLPASLAVIRRVFTEFCGGPTLINIVRI